MSKKNMYMKKMDTQGKVNSKRSFNQNSVNVLKYLRKEKVYDGFESIYDIGAGFAYSSKYFADLGKNVTAVDYNVSLENLEFAKVNNFKFIQGDFYNLDIKDNSVEAIWSSHALEHSTDLLKVLHEFRRTLKTGGTLILNVPTYNLGLVLSGHYNIGFNPGQLIYLLVLSGFEFQDGYALNIDNNTVIVCRKTAEQKTIFSTNSNANILNYINMFPSPIVDYCKKYNSIYFPSYIKLENGKSKRIAYKGGIFHRILRFILRKLYLF